MSAPLGLIAGRGKFPLFFAQEAKKNNQNLVVVALKEEVDEDLAPYAKSLHTLSVAKLDSIIQTLKKEGVQEAVMAGKVEHRKIFSGLIPDLRCAQLLFRIKDRRADTILQAVSEELQKDGIRLMSSLTFLTHLLPHAGLLSKRALTESERKSVEFGIGIAHGVSGLDIGQTVVIKRRMVIAVEAMEGTDACIRRAAALAGEDLVIVKSAKPKQDLRFDVPVIGMATVELLSDIKASVLAIEANKTLMLEKEKLIQRADDLGISLYAWERLHD